MSFHEVRFPTALSFGSLGGPERRTDVVTLANGFEERNSLWAHSRRRYDAGLGMRSLEDVETMIAFFEARRGQLYGFRWKDWSDYRSCRPSEEISFEDQPLAVGDGATSVFQLSKTYASGEAAYQRPLSKAVSGTVRIGADGVELVEDTDWTVDITTAEITFFQPPGAGVVLTAGFEFDVPVRFAVDMIQTSVASFQAGEIPNIPILEIRV